MRHKQLTRFLSEGDYGAWIVEDGDYHYGVIISKYPYETACDGAYGYLHIIDAYRAARKLLIEWSGINT